MPADRRKAGLPLAIDAPGNLRFGVTPNPVSTGKGLCLGSGIVYPEINFTLPTMMVDEAHWPKVLDQYRRMIGSIAARAAALDVPGIVVEFEHLPPMTENPAWGAEITALLKKELEAAYEKSGLPYAIRATIVDLRDGERPPRLRAGPLWEAMRESLHLGARAGADILSIESVGGKEVHDQALMFGDVRGIVYSLGVLASRDMEWLWKNIVDVAEAEGVVPGGDSACGFANTAMQLAGQRQIPETLAAVIRAMTVPRSLVAMECGAVGPSKDCAYEGPALKVITGCPISMEGKSAACAHFSPVGNIACMAADLWSNESVQNVHLLSGSAPEAFLEILAYDCRLLNLAGRRGDAVWLRDLLVESDEMESPQALVLGPEATFEIARSVLDGPDGEWADYERTLRAGRTAVSLIRRAMSSGLEDGRRLELPEKELGWLDRIERELSALPSDPREMADEIEATYGSLFDPKSYGL